MTTQSRHAAHPYRAPILHWVLERDAKTITCQLDTRDDHSYELCVVPHWAPSSAVIERFEGPRAALLRHAEVASRLRDKGWMVIDHVEAGHAYAAA